MFTLITSDITQICRLQKQMVKQQSWEPSGLHENNIYYLASGGDSPVLKGLKYH